MNATLHQLIAMPDQLTTLWQARAQDLSQQRLGKVVLILGHLADVELIYGARLRQNKLAGHSNWQVLIQETRPEHYILMANASLRCFMRLRDWNLEYCHGQDLGDGHYEVLGLIAQHDAKRYAQLEALMTTDA
ncbi:MAG: hypothetical protein AAF708_06975 [Deinococcota bacterium]